MIVLQSNQHAEQRHTVDECLRAVDGIHNPDARLGESSRIVRRFLRKPSILRKLPPLHLMQDTVDLAVYGGDRRTIRLRLHLEAISDQFTHLRAGLLYHFDQRG